MQCADCKRTMRPSATDVYCEWCTSPIEEVRLYPGYIVYKNDGMHSPHYVFRHVPDARRWMKEKGLTDVSVKKVLSPTRFKWRKSKGSISGLTIARRLRYIMDSHQFDPEEPFICLAPDDYTPRFKKRMIKSQEKAEEKSEGDRLMDFFNS